MIIHVQGRILDILGQLVYLKFGFITPKLVPFNVETPPKINLMFFLEFFSACTNKYPRVQRCVLLHVLQLFLVRRLN